MILEAFYKMETSFTPLTSLLGGACIGASAVLLMLIYGKIAGMTGFLTNLLSYQSKEDWSIRAIFISGCIAAPLLYGAVTQSLPEISILSDHKSLLLSGLIVGIGTRLASGCTSGHGICGLARFSPRSLVATLTFMTSMGISVYVIRHVFGA